MGAGFSSSVKLIGNLHQHRPQISTCNRLDGSPVMRKDSAHSCQVRDTLPSKEELQLIRSKERGSRTCECSLHPQYQIVHSALVDVVLVEHRELGVSRPFPTTGEESPPLEEENNLLHREASFVSARTKAAKDTA